MAFETLDEKNLDGEETKTVEEKVDEVMEVDEERVETTEREEEEKSEKAVKRRQRKGIPTSTPVQRPSRERKVVQWYSTEAAESIPSPKGLIIQQGNGTPLKDIPNVAFKLSKRKSDENLQILHRILFGKRTKAYNLKRNLQQFSGFVWVENKEKQREKIRERLDKFVKEQLLDFCDVLDIPVSTATKKDEILGKLLEFLEFPHSTTEVSLADKEQSQKSKKLKRKKRATTGSASRGTSSKKQKKSAKAKKSEDEDEFESADTNHLSDEDDNLVTMRKEESNQEDDESPGEEDEAKEVKVSKRSAGKKSMKRGSGAKVKAEKGSPKNVGKSTESESSPKAKESPEKPVESPHFVLENGVATDNKVTGSPSKSKNSKRKNQKGNEKKSQKNLSDFSQSKKTSNLRVQSSGEEGTSGGKSDVTEPSRDEMHAAVSGILKDVDFNTATLSDVLKKLETIFSMNLMHRKLEVKSIIEEIMSSMTEDEDEEDDAGEADNGSDEDMKIADKGAEEADGNNNH